MQEQAITGPSTSHPSVHAERPGASRAGGLAKGIAAGAVAGAAGAAAMALVMKGLAKAGPEPVRKEVRTMSQQMDATRVEFADRVSEAVRGKPVPDEHEKPASMAAHFATGAIGGAFYGAAAELDERVTLGQGALFGAAFFVASREVALPLLGLAPPATRSPLKEQVETLGLHLLYGVVAESVRGPVRGAMG